MRPQTQTGGAGPEDSPEAPALPAAGPDPWGLLFPPHHHSWGPPTEAPRPTGQSELIREERGPECLITSPHLGGKEKWGSARAGGWGAW